MAIDDFKDNSISAKSNYLEELKDELKFEFNDFNKQAVDEGVYALTRLILNLLLTEPGTYPDTPKMGINIAQYQFEFLDKVTIQKIQRHIREQIDTYIPNNNIQRVVVAQSEANSNIIIIGFSILLDVMTMKTQNAFIMLDQDLNSYIQYS